MGQIIWSVMLGLTFADCEKQGRDGYARISGLRPEFGSVTFAFMTHPQTRNGISSEEIQEDRDLAKSSVAGRIVCIAAEGGRFAVGQFHST